MRAVAAALAAVVLAGCSSDVSADESTGGYVSSNGAITVVPEGEREPAPDITGLTLDGDQVALSDYAGSVVVVNTWYAQCPPCRAEADDLAAAARQLSDVRFLGLNIRDTEVGARSFQETYDVPYPSIFDPTGSQLLEFPPGMAPVAVPTTLVIDADGRIAARILDATTTDTLVDVVQDVEDSGAGG